MCYNTLKSSQNRKVFLYSLFITTILILLFLLSRYNYLSYHTVIELFAIFTGFSITLVAFSTKKLAENPVFTKFGVLYLFVSSVDFLHTTSYKGMAIFPNWGADQPTQFWIIGRLLETVGFVTILFLSKMKEKYFSLIVGTITISSVVSVFFKIFPKCFIESKGLTPFKISMEYILIIILMITIFKALKIDDPSIKTFRKTIVSSVLLTIAGELSFTLYSDVYGFFNFLGHIFRFLSYLVILNGLVAKSLKDPVNNILLQLEDERKRLRQLAYYDQLTGLYSRNFFGEILKNQIAIAEREKMTCEIVIIDIDDFKKINDLYGHLVGDEVLKFVAKCIKESIRSSDIAARYGGDEFVIVLLSALEGAINVVERIRSNLKQNNRFSFPVDISYGFSRFSSKEEYKFAFEQADELLYRMKNDKKTM